MNSDKFNLENLMNLSKFLASNPVGQFPETCHMPHLKRDFYIQSLDHEA